MDFDMEIFSSAERYLAGRMHGEKELFIKLKRKFPKKEKEIQRVIEKCKEVSLINDQEFAQQYTEYLLMLKPQGKMMLQQKLLQKGLSKEIIEGVLKNTVIEKNSILEMAQRKLNTFSPSLETSKKKEKIMRFLLGRGFNYGEVREVVEKIF